VSRRFLIDDSSDIGLRQWATVDDGDGPNEVGITIETESTNVQAALDANQRARSANGQRSMRGTQTWGHHVASIPMGLFEQFCREDPELRQHTPDANARLMAKLRSGEYLKLRTYDGNL